MKKTQKLLALLLLTISLISCKGTSQEAEIKTSSSTSTLSKTQESKFPKSIGIINDYSLVFTEDQKKELSKILYDYDLSTTRQIVIVTIDSISPYANIHRYATELGEEWSVGATEKNNGLVIVLCKPKRKIGIATGYGTELVLTDVICKNVIDSIMIPEFKNDKYYDGVKKGIEELIIQWK